MLGYQIIQAASAKLPYSQSPEADARQLLSFATGVSFSQVPLHELTDPLDGFWELIGQRSTGIPVQHLTGEAAFRHLVLTVGPGVFIPRPETELIVELGLPKLVGRNTPLVVDLCTGSGAIAASFATETAARVYAVELDPVAFDYAKTNLTGTGAELVLDDFRTALPELNSQVDLVVSNPPYVPEAVRSELPADVLRDPELALFGGDDGLSWIPALIETAARLLKPGGWFIFEHDDTHGESAPALLAANEHFYCVSEHLDYASRPRFAMARKVA